MQSGDFERQRQVRIFIAQDNAAALLLKALLRAFEKIHAGRERPECKRAFLAGADRSEQRCAGKEVDAGTGNACASMVPDPTNPSQMVCVDNKGGISQLCCNGNTTTPCFPLENGGTLTRNGRAEAPAPAFPDTTFPKSGTGVLAATFCEAATGTNTIDTTTGLPGPAALLLSGTQDWTEEPAAE